MAAAFVYDFPFLSHISIWDYCTEIGLVSGLRRFYVTPDFHIPHVNYYLCKTRTKDAVQIQKG